MGYKILIFLCIFSLFLNQAIADPVGNEVTVSLNTEINETTCMPDCSCATDTCTGETCSDGCSGTCAGTKNCDSGGGGSPGGSSSSSSKPEETQTNCSTEWICGDWSDCINDRQKRYCHNECNETLTDIKACEGSLGGGKIECGDGTCQSIESCDDCSEDCGECKDGEVVINLPPKEERDPIEKKEGNFWLDFWLRMCGLLFLLIVGRWAFSPMKSKTIEKPKATIETPKKTYPDVEKFKKRIYAANKEYKSVLEDSVYHYKNVIGLKKRLRDSMDYLNNAYSRLNKK